MRFNKTLHRAAAGDRNASPGGDDCQGIAPAENILDFSQDSRASRLLPAIDRAYASTIRIVSSICLTSVLARETNRFVRATAKRIFAEPQTDIEFRAQPEQMDGYTRWIYSSAQ